MKAVLLLLALWAEAAAPKVRVNTQPQLQTHTQLVTLPVLPPSAVLTAPVNLNNLRPVLLGESPTVTPAAKFVPFTFDRAQAHVIAGQMTAERLAEPAANDNGLNSVLQDKITGRLAELREKWQDERVAPANAMNLSPDIGRGHAAEIAVIRYEGANLINVGEEVTRGGEVIGEIDAETETHLIEVASGDLNSGKKSKIQQFIKFLRAEAKRRGKPVKYYYDPKKADPEDVARIIAMGAKQGVQVTFVPIPWEQLPN